MQPSIGIVVAWDRIRPSHLSVLCQVDAIWILNFQSTSQIVAHIAYVFLLTLRVWELYWFLRSCFFSFPSDGSQFMRWYDRHVHGNEPYEHVRFRRTGSAQTSRHAVPTYTEAETTRPLHAGASLRAGTALQATKIPLCTRTRTLGQHDQPDSHAGKNLVPKSSL